jgi:cell division topological specificity factor
MRLLRLFRREPTPAETARARLQSLLSQDRARPGGPDFLPRLKDDLLRVIGAYNATEESRVSVQIKSAGGISLLAVSIELPLD